MMMVAIVFPVRCGRLRESPEPGVWRARAAGEAAGRGGSADDGASDRRPPARGHALPAAADFVSRLTDGVLMCSSSSPRNLAMAFLIGQAAPSARPQIVVPGMMPMLLARLSMRSRSSSRPPPDLDSLDHLVEPAGALAAGGALAAALVGKEAAGVVQVIDDAGSGRRARSLRRCPGPGSRAFVGSRNRAGCRARRPREPHADPAGHCRLGLASLPDAAAVFLDQRAAGDAQGQLDADLAVDVARDRVQLGAITLGRADRLEPVAPRSMMCGTQQSVSTLLTTVGLRKAPSIAGNGRLDPRPAALAFEALDQAGLLTADVAPAPRCTQMSRLKPEP